MANPLKGEIEFEAEGKTYTFRLSVNACCELEGNLGRGFLDISNEMNSWSTPVDDKGDPVGEMSEQVTERVGRIRLGVLRAVVWAGLRQHQPEITIPQAGEIITALGGMLGAIELIRKSFAVAMPQKDDDTARPPMPNQAA